MSFDFNPVPKPPKKEKPKKPWARSSIKPKKTKRKHTKGKQAQRNDFSPKVRRRRMEHANGICEYCQSRRAVELHHVKRRGKGRGVYTNGMYLCWHCHKNIVHVDRTIEDKLVLEYELTYGKYFYMDEKDLDKIPQHEIDKSALRKWEQHNQIKIGE